MSNLNLSTWFDTQANILPDMNDDQYNNNVDYSHPLATNNIADPMLDDFFLDENIHDPANSNGNSNKVNWDAFFGDNNNNNLLWNENDMVDLDKQIDPLQSGKSSMEMNKQARLEEALRKQEELNQKLEAQLARSQLENQRLTSRQSYSQDSNNNKNRPMLGDITSSSRLNSTPRRRQKDNLSQKMISNNGNQNMKSNENFNFFMKPTKPIFQQPIFLESNNNSNKHAPSSATSVNGSPRRRHNKSRSTMTKEREQKMKINFATALTHGNNNSNSVIENDLKFESPTKPEFNLTSPYKGDSITNSLLQSPVIGLGLKTGVDSRREASSNSDLFTFKSSSNETSKSPSTSPIRPIAKFSVGETPSRRRKSVAGSMLFTKHNTMSTPNLGPPPALNSSPMMAIPPYRTESHNNENQFLMVQTPSPELNTDVSEFQNSSPGTFTTGSTTNLSSPILSSPQKITRKLTTLPRGSIDIYVKELPEKMFECLFPDCGKLFKRRYNIRSHIQTHLEDRPYVCDFDGCGKAFVRNHDLVRHKKSHMEKRYACPCGKKFNREDALIVHRSRLICVGGKQFENVVIKRSPRKRGRPRKDAPPIENMSPTKKPDRETCIKKDNNISNKNIMNQPNLTPVGTFDIDDAVTNDTFLNELENELRMTLENEGQLS